MTPRGAAIGAAIAFIVLLSVGSYLLDVPPAVVVIAAVFAIAVILWLGTSGRSRGGS